MRKLNEVRRGIRAKRLVADDIRTEDDEDLSNKEIFEKAKKGDKSILSLPKEKLMIKNKSGNTPIHYLAEKRVKEILELDKSLLRIKNKAGNTPIHYLVRTGIEKFKKGMKYLFNPFQMDY